MAQLKRIDLGAFAAGEIPPPLVHRYLNADRTPIDISGWTVLGFFVEGDGIVQGSLAISDGPNGEVTYVWHPDDTQTAGKYRGLMWVQDDPTTPTVRLASDMFIWTVVDGPGPTPPSTP